MTYKDNIETLVGRLITNPAPDSCAYHPILRALGCQHIARLPTRMDTLVTPGQPPSAYEDLITQTLVQVMRHQLKSRSTITSANILALLDGLLRKDRWRACLQDMDTATDFATLLSYFWCSAVSGSAGVALMRNVDSRVHDTLDLWLQPAISFKKNSPERPIIYDFAAAVFGSAWCAIALQGDNRWEISSIVHIQRPQVLPHLMPLIAPSAEAILPDLEVS